MPGVGSHLLDDLELVVASQGEQAAPARCRLERYSTHAGHRVEEDLARLRLGEGRLVGARVGVGVGVGVGVRVGVRVRGRVRGRCRGGG